MTSVGEHIISISDSICCNITSLSDQRGLMSQNILAQLRNLVEGVAVLVQRGTLEAEYNYDAIKKGERYVRGKGNYSFLKEFRDFLQVSVSHYTMDGDASERLMNKYWKYLFRIRRLLKDSYGVEVLDNLESFLRDLDPSLKEYHDKIAAQIQLLRSKRPDSGLSARYYIHKTRPFFVGGRVYYEVTFYRAINRISKFDRIIAFTDLDMTDKYSVMLTLHPGSIQVVDRTMPITLISEWEVSIRPCEFDNFARLFGIPLRTSTKWSEYRYLMESLTTGSRSLLELMDMPDDRYAAVRAAATANSGKPQIFPVLDEARRVIRSRAPGHNILRYLMLRLHNKVLKLQFAATRCAPLSNLYLDYGCIPFDSMPFCSSPKGHNVRYWDLVESLDPTEREHELLARRVRTNVESYGILYTPVAELEAFGDVTQLIAEYNSRLYRKHEARQLIQDKGHVFIREYEDHTVAILERLREGTSSGIAEYSTAVDLWMDEVDCGIDDDSKRDALKRLFSNSKVALIYGAAGTGKSTMVGHIARYFNDKTKLFLAHTNPAKDNLERRVTAENSTFRTIRSHICCSGLKPEYDLLVIDECSIVSNADLLKVLENTSYELLVLVGDVYQIESIRFGNWFSIASSFIPSSSVFELTTPFRTKSKSLLGFWDKVRGIEDDIAEVIARNGYSTLLDRSLFEAKHEDEIILCLNYDGLYGINNVNRFLQNSNPNPPFSWRASTYRVGDPVLFHETGRFGPLIYNNLKGRITDIVMDCSHIQFDVELDRPVAKSDIVNCDIEWVEGSTVRFRVYDYDASDEDDDSVESIVPFQVAYAVSIHKAQGLEYDSVKIVVTDANKDEVTHSIFYTAVTRARESLKIFWTPETQESVLKSLKRGNCHKDVALLSARRGLTRVTEAGRASR